MSTPLPPDYCADLPNGNHEYPGDPSQFVKCANGYAYTYDCPEGTHYDPDSRECVPN
ncbi:chitin binding peritrophin-A domain-containing protein [Nocardia arthritidis]|uniref:Chitin-binding type-2 domain-containing protein n=1 Tax=Nocardia arthritidis TaxID=228602 RepID=A0A6G9Y9R5_9NOCA|nr:hypothetical protein F5544_09585 [Nocardia arthritidis]